MKQQSTLRFSTTQFEFAHGKAPRGRGSWAFAFDGKTELEDLFWTPGGTLFAEAKKLAKAAAPEGTRVAEVQS